MINIEDWPLFGKEELFNYIRYNSYRSEQYKLLYVATPKVACTSLKWWFAALEGHSKALRSVTDSIETDPDLIIHDSFHIVAPNVTGLLPDELFKPITSDEYFRFAVVRNPYKRIFSAWQSKILLSEPLQIAPYVNCNFFKQPVRKAVDISTAFEGFLEHLAANEAPSYWDVHWTPQATLLRPDLINYSKLVKIEDAKELSQALADRLGTHIPNPFLSRRSNESLIPYLPELITERSSELIQSLYDEDFEVFGYNKQPPEAKETFSDDQFSLAFKAITLIRGRHQRLGERNVQIIRLNQSVAEFDTQATNLKHILAEREGQINAYSLQAEQFDAQLLSASTQVAALSQSIVERDGKVAALSQSIVERDGKVAALSQSIVERDGKVAALSQSIVERDGKVAALSQSIVERDGKVAALSQSIVERDGKVAALSQSIMERDGRVALMNQEIADLRCSTSWRITKPLRFVSCLLKGRWKGAALKLGWLRKPNLRFKRAYHELIHDLDKLPNDFNQDVYLKLNPDIGASGIDPVTHYLLHGRQEGRIFSLPTLDFCGEHNFKDDHETVLVVSHEASRTGAPVLSLNLVQSLVGSYNVVVLLLGDGPLTEAFRLTGAAVITASNMRGDPVLAHLAIGQMCEQFNFKFALVNSIESRIVLPVLCDYYVPAISLIHEFASYTRPRDAIRYALFWSGEVVFSTNITLENALAEYPDLGAISAHVIPQGRCLLPLEGFSKEEIQTEKRRMRGLIRPKGIAEDTVVILGAGFVQLRKGVDLFLECAARVVRTPGGRKCRFVWVGKGYDPDNDVGYSVYLTDQIHRAGLQDYVSFIDETTAIEIAYEEADLLLLSSRLDPLPNVAIDAMAHGVPVLCFDKTTGIADFLIASGLRNHCVAEYLDTSDIAEKILDLANSQALREFVANRCHEASVKYFNMKEYVARLEILAIDVCHRTQQEKLDAMVILASGLFRRDFSCPPNAQIQSIECEVRTYVRAWVSGIGRRKPLPGFHPGIYKELRGLTRAEDPFADYLRAGRPEGPWSYPVIVARKTTEADLPENQRIALHLHVHYLELLPEIMDRLSHNRIRPDLFISVTSEDACELVAQALKHYQGRVVDIQLVPNRGRDIGPFLTAFGQGILACYDYVGHVHTKKTVDVKDPAIGKLWYVFLLENLLGGDSGAMADSILAEMKSDTSIGMVFPDEPNVVGWSANRVFAEPIAERMGLGKLPEQFIFPVGTMFWARASALAPLMSLKLDWNDYPEEPLPYDGTLLHAIERLFPLALTITKSRSATTNVMGLTR